MHRITHFGRYACFVLLLTVISTAYAQRQSGSTASGGTASFSSPLDALTAEQERELRVQQQNYYAACTAYYDGDYGKALPLFRSLTLWPVTGHAMAGECHYRLGEFRHALGECTVALERAWQGLGARPFGELPLQVQPTHVTSRLPIPWGVRQTAMTRATKTAIKPRMEALAPGYVGVQPWPVQAQQATVLEVRSTALALRRRQEILGPVSAHDPFTRVLAEEFSRPTTAKDPWTKAWSGCLTGLACAAAGRASVAEATLQGAVLLEGQYDHELTATALLGLGRLAFDAGRYKAAVAPFHEASLAAAAYDQVDLVGDAFRGAGIAHIVAGAREPYAPLSPACNWVGNRSRAVRAELLLLGAENVAALGQMAQASSLLTVARRTSENRDMQKGVFGGRLQFQAALLGFSQGNLAAGSKSLSLALARQKTASLWLFQIAWVEALYASNAITPRVADQLYSAVLREPSAVDWSVDPLETLSVGMTPLSEPLEHWFELLLARGDFGKALAVADRIRRHRFLVTLALGGRLLAFRWILEGPEAALDRQAQLQRQDLFGRYPNYTQLSGRAANIRRAIDAAPLVPEGSEAARNRQGLFEELARVSTVQELILREIALRREPAVFVFPPQSSVEQIQTQMRKEQLILSYLVTRRGLTAFALSRNQCTAWPVENPDEIARQITSLRQQWGLAAKGTAVSAVVLKDKGWRPLAAELFTQLTKPLPPSTWDTHKELVVVPDGKLWHLPLEALLVGQGQRLEYLIAKMPIRYVPTVSLANAHTIRHKPEARTAIFLNKPKGVAATTPAAAADMPAREEAASEIHSVLPLAERVQKLSVPSGLFSATCDRMIVLNDLAFNGTAPYAWSLTAAERGKPGGTLEDWFALPWQSPAEIVLSSFQASAGKDGQEEVPGRQLFLAVCGLMASGSRSVLMSRWPQQGQTAADRLREYVQELPHTSAADAWRRSVLLAQNSPVDPEQEPRVAKDGWDATITADHPFFWAGYLLVDVGSRPATPEADR